VLAIFGICMYLLDIVCIFQLVPVLHSKMFLDCNIRFPTNGLHPFKQVCACRTIVAVVEELEPSFVLYVPSGQSMHVDI